ncbi:MAG: OmpH family outer membrane protein [Candidatus Omnitrophota bacterium]
MKRLALVILGITLGLILAANLGFAEEKIAYVDLSRVFEEYKKTKAYDKVLEDKQKEYEKTRESKVSEVKALQEKLSLLSNEEKEARKGELEQKIAQLQEFDRNVTQDLRKQRDEKVQDIFSDIKKTIDSYAKKQGFTIVFDKRALIYYDENLDITDKILGTLNK